jgi:hypothetical protein
MFFDRFFAIAGLSVLHFLHYTGGWKLHYECPWSVAATQVGDRHVRCAQAPHIKPKPSKAATLGFTRDLHAEGHRILHFPKPDYSKIPPKVDCWIKKPKIGVDDKKVGGGVIFRGSDVIVKTAWYLLEDLILFPSHSIYVRFMLIPWNWLNHVNLNHRLSSAKRVLSYYRRYNTS